MEPRCRILIVDDQLVNRQILAGILREEYEILTAENGRQALTLLRQERGRISAVLLDLLMPVMDGFTLLDAMGQEAAIRDIPVLVSTGCDDEQTEVRALTLGAFDFLTKPYRPEAIRSRVANAIRLREAYAAMRRFERDELTGLLGRQAFYDQAQGYLRARPGQEFDLICADVDRFKLVNELFGTASGDQLLRQFAAFFSEGMGDEGVCGRLVSDTLVAVVPRPPFYPPADFEWLIERLNQTGISIPIYVRFGIYEIRDRTTPIGVMCDRARLAIASIKGKYGIYHARYDDSIRQLMLYEQQVTSAMKPALEAGQFIVYYQPKYDLADGGIAGAEALVRWQHPEQGLLAPGSFIPLFERNGFITDLDLSVWHQVCRQLRLWMDAGVPVVPVSVNISRVDLYRRDLVHRLLELTDRYAIDLRLLHLEITETAYTQDPRQLIEMVGRFKALGFVIEMDDFGSGYSSLNMLSSLPIDILKLDIKLLHNAERETQGDGILRFIIELAQWLKLRVVAEGVESQEQARYLQALRCNFAQGFCYARPMPADEFRLLLESAAISSMQTAP